MDEAYSPNSAEASPLMPHKTLESNTQQQVSQMEEEPDDFADEFEKFLTENIQVRLKGYKSSDKNELKFQ